MRARQVTPHIAVQGTVSKLGKVRKTAIDKRTLRHQGYAISLRCRKRIEEVFGWIKAQAVRISRRLGADFARCWARVSRHSGQPFHGIVGRLADVFMESGLSDLVKRFL